MTYSILARDPASGALGAAVASRFFAVGAMCIHVDAGVGALSVQALTNPMYVRPALDGLRTGRVPGEVMDALLRPDPGAHLRQFHLLDAAGRGARHTGPGCVGWAGDAGAVDVSVAGNMLVGPEVIAAMLDGFARGDGSLAERLMAALEAGEAAGGDKRGKQSAAVKVYEEDPYPVVDIRVDDSADPLPELRRLYRVGQERFAVYRRHLPGVRSPWGTLDRAVINADVERHGQPAASGDGGPRM